ncbi:multicopper oxidase domain-containing protein [Sphaerisporangium sp. NBC_01403]|uniref:multicopper oxidase domain-containing protein n=1 Tax=Sphaerisporangium sp. NBC_01403 TaxID=2903599 RepID=UPI0032560CDE
MPDGQLGYGLEPGKATIPGPLIEMVEGETLEIEMVNNLDVTASLHVHGVDYETTSDGTRMNDSVVEPGGRRTYTAPACWKALRT